MNPAERISALDMQKKELVRRQSALVLEKIVSSCPELPVSIDFVKSAVDTNFQFYFGVVTRRIRHERNPLAPRLSMEQGNENYIQALNHIGYVASRDALVCMSTGAKIYEFDFAQQQVVQEDFAA